MTKNSEGKIPQGSERERKEENSSHKKSKQQ
jgi:hypothetical protein